MVCPKPTDAFHSHANWLRSLRADYDQRVSEALVDAGEQTGDASELDASWLDGALGDVAAAEGANFGYVEEDFEAPVYRSIGSLAISAPPEDAHVHYEPPAHSETGRPQSAWRAEPRFSARALEASWLSENPPLLCRQKANSDVALNREHPSVDPFHPMRSAP